MSGCGSHLAISFPKCPSKFVLDNTLYIFFCRYAIYKGVWVCNIKVKRLNWDEHKDDGL